MSLRTYSLIIHPAYLAHIEDDRRQPVLPFSDRADSEVGPPKIIQIKNIADYLGINPLMIGSFLRNKEKHYRTFEITKRSGAKRRIDAPRTFLKVTQWWILDTILSHFSESEYAYGFTKGKSFVENARRHIGASHVLNLDIENFFPMIGIQSVYLAFRRMGYNANAARILSEICSYEDHLPQGAPTSPKLSNLVFHDIDLLLAKRCATENISYSRYADDMTFSASSRISDVFFADVVQILSQSGFTINSRKTRFMGPNQRKEVTGLVLGKDDIALPLEFLNGCRGWFHKVQQLPQQHVNDYQKIAGTLNLLKQVKGRGSGPVIKQGSDALQAITNFLPPKLVWESD